MPDFVRPKIFQFNEKNEQVDITTTLIGNGSKGTVRYTVFTPNEVIGPTANLFCMLITDLVPYEQKDPTSFAPSK